MTFVSWATFFDIFWVIEFAVFVPFGALLGGIVFPSIPRLNNRIIM
jgi:hypothetical protein